MDTRRDAEEVVVRSVAVRASQIIGVAGEYAF